MNCCEWPRPLSRESSLINHSNKVNKILTNSELGNLKVDKYDRSANISISDIANNNEMN